MARNAGGTVISTAREVEPIRRLLAILAADAVGYSRLMALDDHATLRDLDKAREIFRSAIVLHGGRVIDMAGDSVLAVFDTAMGAVKSSISIQAELARAFTEVPLDRRMIFRVGLHLGDVIEKADGTIYGDGVNIAARLQALARPSCTVASQAIRDAVRSRGGAVFVDLGEHLAKNISEPVRAFECRPALSAAEAKAGSTLLSTVQHLSPADMRREIFVSVVVLALLATALGWFAFAHFTTAVAVAPYSLADRRMTFAVLPIGAPQSDRVGQQLAHDLAETAQQLQEARVHWARVAPRAVVLEALAKATNSKQLGEALGAHFLLRGNVVRADKSYTVDLAVVDAETERVLASKALVSEGGANPTVSRYQIDGALANLTYKAMQAEVERARAKPYSSLDVRDLTFRAYVDWGTSPKEPAAVYAVAQADLDRALALAPNDLVALRVTAEMNLCECARTWARGDRLESLVRLGTRALDRYLELDPKAPTMLYLRSRALFEQRRLEEAILVADDVLLRDPYHEGAMVLKSIALLKLHRLPDALAASEKAVEVADNVSANLAAAEVLYALRNDSSAIVRARRAVSLMSSRDREDPGNSVGVLLIAAAQARLGHLDRAKEALAEFRSDVRDVRSIRQMKLWLGDALDLDGEDLFDGLRMAGVSD